MSKIREEFESIREKISDESEDYILAFEEYGYVDSIHLYVNMNDINIKICIWDSDSEPRDFIEEINEYEPLEQYLIRKISEIITSLNKLRSILTKSNATNSDEVKEQDFILDNVIGLNKLDSFAYCYNNGYIPVIVYENGISYGITTDVNLTRICLYIENDVVVKYTIG